MSQSKGVVNQAAAIDRSDQPVGISRALIVPIILVTIALGIAFVARENAEPLILALLVLFAVIGVFSLFAGAVGIIHFGSAAAIRNDLTKLLIDAAPDGVIVTDNDGRVVYANSSYLAMTGATGEHDVRPVERAFSGDPDVSEAIYRLAQAARSGTRLTEEFRIASMPPTGAAAWFRIKVRPVDRPSGRRETAWTVSDVTRDRGRQENVFQELQHAIDYLDHAPAGFFSADPSGDIVYMNATLAGWLDFDLAQFGSGGLKLNDVVPGNSGALVAATAGEPGGVKTEIFDVD